MQVDKKDPSPVAKHPAAEPSARLAPLHLGFQVYVDPLPLAPLLLHDKDSDVWLLQCDSNG